MPDYPRTRRDLFALIEERLSSNQERLDEAGERPKALKVFWFEVNERFHPRPPPEAGWTLLERDFYVRAEPSGYHVWLDTSDPRIWYAYTFGDRQRVGKSFKTDLLAQHGVDRVWLAEPFLDRIQRETGYDGRGFRISYQSALVREPAERPNFSAKFWVGSRVSWQQEEFLRTAERTFSKSSIRLGRGSAASDGSSGVLLELRNEGQMTITAADDPEEVLGLVREIGERYARELHSMEERRRQSPRPVEITFGMSIDLDGFREVVEGGQGGTRLWLQRYGVEDGLHRYTGVDLHTRELINLDVAEDYAYLVTQREGCMNAAPRLMTISAHRMTGKASIFYEGERLFA